MRIVYDSQVFSWQRYGGISRYFYELIQRMVPKEDVLLHEGAHINSYGLGELNGYAKYWGHHVKRHIPKTGRLKELFNSIHFKSFVRGESIDVYHPTYYKDFDVRGAKKVVTVYDMIHELFPEIYAGDPTIADKAKILAKADGIIAISESTKHDLMRLLGVPEEKIRVIYLANSLTGEPQDNPLVQGDYILYVGTRSGYKNFMGLAKAYASSQYKSDVRLVCFGGGNFSKEEREWLDQLGVWKNVAFYSGDDCVLSNLYQFAVALVYPSLYEGFGLPILEAMHYGTPVLTGNTSSLPEVAGDAADYFNPREPDDICEAIDRLLSNDERRQELRMQGRQRGNFFSWDRCADETLEFYRTFT